MNRKTRIDTHIDLLQEGLQEVFGEHAALEPDFVPNEPMAVVLRNPVIPPAMEEQLDELFPEEDPAEGLILSNITSAYASLFHRHFAPHNLATDERSEPFIQCNWMANTGVYEIIFWPYPDSAHRDGYIDPRKFDHELFEHLRVFFDALYERADRRLKVLSPPHRLCENNEFMMRTVDPFAFLVPLKAIIEDAKFTNHDKLPDFVADRKAKGVTRKGKQVKAFQSDEEYDRYVAQRQADLNASFEGAAKLMLNDQDRSDFCMTHMPMQVFMSHADAVVKSGLVSDGGALPFSVTQLEVLIYEALDIKVPPTHESRRYILQ